MLFKSIHRDRLRRILVAAAVISIFVSCPLAIADQAGEEALPSYYPPSFDGLGSINRITSEEVVIEDREYQFSLRTTFNTPQMRDASRFSFQAGSYVGYILNDQQEIDSLWLIHDSIDYRTR